MQYYFLDTFLPPLKYGEENEIHFQDFKDLLFLNLTQRDLIKLDKLFRIYDLMNLRAFWKQQPLGLFGNWDEIRFETLDYDEEDVPRYIREFLENYPQKEEQIAHFPQLLLTYYHLPVPKGFLSWWLKFEAGLRLNLTAIRAIVQNRSLDDELIFKNRDDEEAQEIKLEVAAKEYRPKPPYHNLMDLYLQHHTNPLELDQELDRFRFKAVEDQLTFDHFSINYVLAYVVLYMMNLKFTLRKEPSATSLVEHYLKEVF